MAKTKKGSSVGKVLAVEAGIAAVGAGAYYLLGPKSKAHQKKAKALYNKAKKEVKGDIKKAKVVAKEMKSEWKGAKKIVKKATKTAKKTIKKAVRATKKRA